MALGARLKKLREDKGITAEQLANELNLLKTVVWGFEMDKKEPTASQLLKYSDFFGVSLDYLIGRNETASKGSFLGDDVKAQFFLMHGEQVTDEEVTEAVTYIKAKRMVMEALQR